MQSMKNDELYEEVKLPMYFFTNVSAIWFNELIINHLKQKHLSKFR